MRKLVLRMSLTLDGFACGPNGEFDWFMKTRSEDGAAWTNEKISHAGAHLLGRKSFEQMAGYWASSKDATAATMNDIPKIVFSKKGFDPSKKPDGSDLGTSGGAKLWSEARVISDLLAGITELKKQEGKNLVAHGGVSFAQSIVKTGLVDEFWLARHPVAIGKGLPLFAGIDTPIYLKLVETKTFSSGTVGQVYRL